VHLYKCVYLPLCSAQWCNAAPCLQHFPTCRAVLSQRYAWVPPMHIHRERRRMRLAGNGTERRPSSGGGGRLIPPSAPSTRRSGWPRGGGDAWGRGHSDDDVMDAGEQGGGGLWQVRVEEGCVYMS